MMSGRTYGYTYTNPLGVLEGPGMNAFNRQYKNYFASQRVKVLPLGSSLTTITLAALNRPEAHGYLDLRLPTTSAATPYYSIEYRERSGYDQSIPRDTVLIHLVSDKGYLITADPTTTSYTTGSERLPGETFVTPEGITVSVVSFDATAHTATVQVGY